MKRKWARAIVSMLCIASLTLAGCGTSQKDSTSEAAEEVTAEESAAEETEEEASTETAAPEYKILQDRVIEVKYNEFDMDAGAAYLNKYDLTMGGCSAVRVLVDGKVYVGRDYDFYCSDSPAFVVRNDSGAIRTIGIGNSPASLEAWTDDYQLNENILGALPFLCCDVMSEAGLYCETNIRPYEEDLVCMSTNPGAPRRCTQTFMQTMLSQYATIDEVLEHLNDYDWFDLSALGFEQSFFLTDQSGRSVIIEFGANKAMWQEADYNANFFINDELYATETLGCGELRLARELSYKPYVRTEDDIFTMMELGAYDQFYQADVDVDFAIPEYYELIGYDKNTAAADPEGARAACAKAIETLSSWTWEERIENHAWESTFITAANVTDLYMHVHFSEHYNIDFTVGFDPADEKAETIPELTKIADNLYEVTYDTDFDWNNKNNFSISGFSCSGVQNGQYRGRNYDWYYADTDLCITHTTVTENRPHASVGVGDMSFMLLEDGSLNYAKLPFVTVDGINDAGVCIQVNVMPYGENGIIEHTETTDDDLAGGIVVRYILDYADSVEDAVALLKEKDIHSEMGTAEEIHWLISGPASKTDSTTKTVVCEVFPDGLHVTENFVNDKPIMTNFNVSNFDGSAESVGVGFGYERWQILDKYYDQANSVMGTFDLMEKIYFSKFYDLYLDNYWYSEFGGVDLCDYYSADELKGLLGEEVYNFYMDNYGGVYYNSTLCDGEAYLAGDPANAGILAPAVQATLDSYNAQEEGYSTWITIHTSVYDLDNKTLNIQVRESQDHLQFAI